MKKIQAPREIVPVNGHFDYDQVPRGHYEKIIWNDHPIRSFWHQKRFVEMETMMATDSTSVILDYGCASGSFLGSFRKPYASAVGVDIAKTQIDLANEKYGSSRLRFVASDFESMAFQEGSFDFIVVSEVIEHISYQGSREMLVKFGDLLKPKGQLILSTPNYHSLWPLIELFVNRFSEVDYDHQHINKLHEKKCRKILDESGFRIDRYLTTFVLSPFVTPISAAFAGSLYEFEKKYLPAAGSIILLSASKK